MDMKNLNFKDILTNENNDMPVFLNIKKILTPLEFKIEKTRVISNSHIDFYFISVIKNKLSLDNVVKIKISYAINPLFDNFLKDKNVNLKSLSFKISDILDFRHIDKNTIIEIENIEYNSNGTIDEELTYKVEIKNILKIKNLLF